MEKDRKQFIDYLKAVKTAVVGDELGKYSMIHLVVGNEACDLDSAVSALAYAFHLSHRKGAKPSSLVIPVLNIPEDDYILKTEVVYLLHQEGVHSTELVFVDQLDVAGLNRSCQQLWITLVDHHVPIGAFAGLERAVQEIIDHHVVLPDKETDLIKNIKQTIEPVGSCATLIGEIVLTGSAGGTVNATIAALLRQTIILDTLNFSSVAKKTTPKDEIMVKELEMADCLGAAQSRSLVFSNLIQAKSDVSGLSTVQLLKKDLKVLRVAGLQVAVSSIPVLVKEYFCQNQRQQEVADRCRSQSIDAAVVLGVSMQGDVARDILIYSSNKICLEKIADGLEKCSSPVLGLESSSSFCRLSTLYMYFTQTTTSASRKQILPVLASILEASSSAICRSASRKCSSDVPETATPPNSFIGQAYFSDSHSVFTNVNRRILQMDSKRGARSQPNDNLRFPNQNDPLTPSNTFVDDSGKNLMRDGGGQRMRDSETDELHDKMTLLKLRQDANDDNDLPCDLFNLSFRDADDHGREIFDMEDDECIDRAISGQSVEK